MNKNSNNILVINDIDESVNYSKSSVDNHAYMQIELDDLYAIFCKSQKAIYNVDTSNCLTLILNTGEEISLNTYMTKVIGHKRQYRVRFLKITTPELLESGNDILISCDKHDHDITKESINWESCHVLLNDYFIPYTSQENHKSIAGKDYDGYLNSYNIYKGLYKIGGGYPSQNIPAICHCAGHRKFIQRKCYEGYLPSAGQMKIIADYISMINNVLSTIGSSFIDFKNHSWWTSTEYAYDKAFKILEGRIVFGDKFDMCMCFPLYTVKRLN